MNKKTLLVLIGISVITLMTSVALAGTISKKNNKPGKVSSAYVLGSSQVGSTDVFEVTIHSVTKNEKKDYAFKYNQDTDYMLIVDVSVKNKTSKEQNLIPSSQFYIRTEDALYFTPHVSMYVTNPVEFQQVAPGQTVKGEVSFAIPKSLPRPLLYVDLGWGGHVPVVYDILH